MFYLSLSLSNLRNGWTNSHVAVTDKWPYLLPVILAVAYIKGSKLGYFKKKKQTLFIN